MLTSFGFGSNRSPKCREVIGTKILVRSQSAAADHFRKPSYFGDKQLKERLSRKSIQRLGTMRFPILVATAVSRIQTKEPGEIPALMKTESVTVSYREPAVAAACGFTLDSATVVSFLSAATSSFNVCWRRLAA